MKLHQVAEEKHLLCTIVNLHFWLYLHLTTSVRCMLPPPFCLKVKLSQVSGNFDTVHGLRYLALGTFEVSKKCWSDFQSEDWLELLLRIFPVVMPGKKDNRSDLARKNEKSHLMTQGRLADETFEDGTQLDKTFYLRLSSASFFLSLSTSLSSFRRCTWNIIL